MSNIRVLNNISLYNSITATSGVTTNTLTVNSNASANKLSIGGAALNGYNLAVTGDAYISGNLTLAGSANFHNATYTTTSALSVSDSGTGPALFVQQTGDQPIAAFYDDNSIALYIDGHTARAGNVGIGTSTPDYKLTVVGDISASGRIFSNYTINKFVSTFGNESNLSYTIIHGLGVQDVVVSIVDASTQEVVYPLVTNTATNQIIVSFAQAPGNNAYKAIVIG
jgi:hypothetical protein